MRWMPPHSGISYAMMVPLEPNGGHIDDDNDLGHLARDADASAAVDLGLLDSLNQEGSAACARSLPRSTRSPISGRGADPQC